MIKTVDARDFIKEFEACGRKNQFTESALETLFDWLEECEPNMELDVIAICCDWTEYESEEELVDAYGYLFDEDQLALDEMEISEALDDYTVVLYADNGNFVVADF